MTDNVTPDNQTAAQEMSAQATMTEHLRQLLGADLQDAGVVQDQIVLRIPASRSSRCWPRFAMTNMPPSTSCLT